MNIKKPHTIKRRTPNKNQPNEQSMHTTKSKPKKPPLLLKSGSVKDLRLSLVSKPVLKAI